jgi:hypothetical protein
MNTARDVKETLSIVIYINQGRQFNRLCNAPVKLGITVGLDLPLNQLKNWILNRDVSVHVLTGLAGSGKTTLATLLCWDNQVRGNIYNSLSTYHFYYMFMSVNVVSDVGIYASVVVNKVLNKVVVFVVVSS